MREREPFDELLRSTLQRAWSEQYGITFQVSPGGGMGAQRWKSLSVLNAYYTTDAVRDVSRFLRRSFGFTAARHRALPQYLAAAALSSSFGLRLLGRRGFCVRPPLVGASQTLVMPGNQRIRILDFRTRRVRAVLKAGFDPGAMRREIAIRGGRANGPFQRMTQCSHDGTWFEEPILAGFVLSRCPPWVSRERAVLRTFAELDAYQAQTTTTQSARVRADALALDLTRGAAALEERYGFGTGDWLRNLVEPLARAASCLGEIEICTTHGDLQPGNILVERDSGRIVLIDWERSATRFAAYDRLVYGLGTRRGRGFADRFRSFVEGVRQGFPLDRLPADRDWRRAALAMFVLEDLSWCIDDSLCATFRRPSASLAAYRSDLCCLGSRWLEAPDGRT